MGIEVHVTSDRIGGNPGGRCEIRNGSPNPMKAYFKYVIGSKLPRPNPLCPQNQPFYEAITVGLVQRMKLETPEVYVLLNKNKDVRFTGWEKFAALHGHKDPSGRAAYFVSKLTYNPPIQSIDEEVTRNLKAVEPYLKALQISDIMNKKENFAYISNNGQSRVNFIDLGCSFVHAVQGLLEQPHNLKFDLNRKDIRNKIRDLSHFHLALADDSTYVNLGKFVEAIPSLEIQTLNPARNSPIGEFLSDSEIEYIVGIIAYGLHNNLHFLKERDKLL